MPISSRTTESGWEYLSRDRVQAFPVGSDIRSPEIHTPSHRSPVNREVFDFAGNAQPTAPLVMEGPAPEHVVPRADGQAPERPAQRAMPDDQAPERLAQRAASSSSSPEKSITKSEDARAVRDRQLRDLLTTLGIKERLTSSSSSATKGVSYDGNPSSGFAVAHVVAGQTKPIMLPRNIDDSNHASQLMRLEQKVEEMRIEMQKAQKAEQRLRIDRDEWRLMAENLQAPEDDDAEGEEDDNHDEDIFLDAHDGDPDPEPDDDDPGDGPSRRNRRGPGHDPPDGDDPDGGDDPEYTDVKISRREADKVVVPPCPTVTHLGKLDVSVHCQCSQRMCRSEPRGMDEVVESSLSSTS